MNKSCEIITQHRAVASYFWMEGERRGGGAEKTSTREKERDGHTEGGGAETTVIQQSDRLRVG
jgi:hypothetical protein